MNSEDRKKARYERRSAQRLEKEQSLVGDCDDFDKVFTFENLYDAFKKCCKGVNWKASTQKYSTSAFLYIIDTLDKIKSGKYKSKGFYEFDICDRGKNRHIKSVHISDRVVQRCLCDNALVPIFSRSFIYDNGACLKDKGTDFAIQRFALMLKRHWRQYGAEGYVLCYDFSKYFDNINHEKLKEIVDKCFKDKRLVAFIGMLIDEFGEEKGLGLGSQISQICALKYPDNIDHYFKEVRRIKGYIRYNDDGRMIHVSKEYLKECLEDLKRLCAEKDITLNIKKTQIVKITQGITFLKHRFILDAETGKVIIKPTREKFVRMRRKLRKFKQWFDEGKMSYEDIKQSYESWRGYIAKFNVYKTLKDMDALFYKLFLEGE